MLLLLLLVASGSGESVDGGPDAGIGAPVEAVPTPPGAFAALTARDSNAPQPPSNNSQPTEPPKPIAEHRKPKAEPLIDPPLAHPPPPLTSIFHDSPVHPPLPGGPPPPGALPPHGAPHIGLPPHPVAPIFHDSPVEHLPPPPPPAAHPEPIYTDRKCRIEEVELVAEVCLPTIVKDCGPVVVQARTVAAQEKCVDVAKTVCTESEEEVDNELCYYTYTEGEVEGEVTSVDVAYSLKCEDAPQHYGGYGKDQSKVCYNKPAASPAKSPLALEVPVPERKCENRPITIPRVKCEEVVEERCFQLPTSTLESSTLEKCATALGPPKCRKVPVKLPRQVCSRVIPVPKPAPAPLVHHAIHQPVHAVHHGVHHGVHHQPVHAVHHQPVHAVHHTVHQQPHHALHQQPHLALHQQPLLGVHGGGAALHQAAVGGHSFINLSG